MDPHDEYIDYSCSTSIERLARDIETSFRSWHLQESDRHASMRDSSSCGGGGASTIAGNSRKRRSSDGDAIRSTVIPWNVSYYAPNNYNNERSSRAGGAFAASKRISADIDLELNLWDGPRMNQKNRRHYSSSNDSNNSDVDRLPLSLQRTPTSAMMIDEDELPANLLDDFSAMFGIGQHITLTPCQPDLTVGSGDGEKNNANDGSSSSMDLVLDICGSLLDRHLDFDTTATTTAMTQVLSTWLQTALNMATTSAHTSVPAFGIWGYYRKLPPFVKPYSNTVPLWMQGKPIGSSSKMEDVLRNLRHRQPRKLARRLYSKNNSAHPLSPCITGHLLDTHVTATFCVQAVPANCRLLWKNNTKGQSSSSGSATSNNTRWTTWARLLQQQTGEEQVTLCAARQIYIWTKPTVQSRARLIMLEGGAAPLYRDLYHGWRQTTRANTSSTTTTPTQSPERRNERSDGRRRKRREENEIIESIREYREACRIETLSILEKAWKGRSDNDDDPLWGPPYDPLQSVQATATFTTLEKPLLRLPFPSSRSKNISAQDQIEAEETMESAVLDPYTAKSFTIAVSYDHDIPQTSLAATQRCVLAALIRTATLPGETLLSHLVNESLMEGWDVAAGNIVAGSLARKAHVGNLTMALVAAMDWSSVAAGASTDDLMEFSQAQDIVNDIMDGVVTLQYPSPPDAVFSDPPLLPPDQEFTPLLKSAAPGRLLSILCMHMARVRSPSNMAMVWNVFVATLRRKWELRESLPHMGYIPGIDPPPEEVSAKKCFSTIGVQASLSAQVNSSEPEPDDIHCLIGQKLQVFGVCLETVVALEMREVEEMENRYNQDAAGSFDHHDIGDPMDLETDSDGASVTSEAPMPAISTTAASPGHGAAETKSTAASTAVVTFAEPHPSTPDDDGANRNSLSSTRTLFHGSIVDGLPQIDGMRRRGGDDLSTVLTAQFFDAEEGDTIAYAPPELTLGQLLAENADHVKLRRRRGARCPIQGANLIETGDQLYAPYLQRPFPLTDDAITQRRGMLSRQKNSAKASSTAARRLEVAHLLQKPKLLSDMRAFKAANPGAIFQDFMTWYGNPTDPLEEYDNSQHYGVTDTNVSVSIKLDRAAEGIRVLSMTRDFWSNTWEEATPIPASLQDPLFDASMTAEMALDFLETLHPASLLCQVMAVNLSAAFFTLNASAGRARKIISVNATLDYLRSKVEAACQSLADDVVSGIGSIASEPTTTPPTPANAKEVPSSVASIKSLMACEMACVALQESEIIVSRAISLLHKFPQEVDLVESLMKNPEGTAVHTSTEGRQEVFDSILEQQERAARKKLSHPPTPSIKEYVFRNENEAKPCQLCVRHCEDTSADDSLVLALNACKRDD